MKIITPNSLNDYNDLVIKLNEHFNIVDTPENLFKNKFSAFFFLDYDDVTSREGNFFACFVNFLTRIGEEYFYFKSLDPLLEDNLSPLYDDNFYEFNEKNDSPIDWKKVLYSATNNIPHLYFHDIHVLLVLFGETEKWGIFMRKYEDFVVVGLDEGVIKPFLDSFSMDKVNGFKNIDDLVDWLSQIIGPPSREKYIASIREFYESKQALNYF